MPDTSCPPDDVLVAFARNALRLSQMDEIAGHVVRCAVCEQKIGMVADRSPELSETLVPTHPGKTVSLGGALLDDRYVLHERLGAGGMGYVYRAEQVKPVRRQVAVKVMRPGLDSAEFLERFEGERQALAVMNHDNIARVFDAGTTTDGRPFLALELVNGLPVTRWCDTARLSTRERVALMVPVCRAVQHAHLKGVIHRDLKPSNVLVGEVDGKPVPKVIDFGIAKATGQGEGGHTRTGVVVGTPEYMSPEQAGLTGADVDTRSDVYALGVMLYELLVGSTPFPSVGDGGSVWELLRRIREEDPPTPGAKLAEPRVVERLADARRSSPERLRRELTGELRWVVMKALERERERRYQSANALADDLERYLRDEPLDAGPPSALYRANKFVSRNRGGVLAAGAVLVALLAAVIGTTAGLLRSLRAEGQTRDALVAEGVARLEAEKSAEQARQDKATAERATAAAEKARADAEESQNGSARAQQRTRIALFAVTDLVTGGPLGRSAQATAAEKQFLADILKLLRKFGTDADGLTPDIRGECLFRVGLLQLRLGQEGDAEQTFRDALAVWEKLNTDTPSATTPRLEMAKVCSELGWVMMRKNQPEAARELFDRAVTTADALADDHPTPVHQALKSKVRGIRADFYFRRGDVRKAVDELTAVVEPLKRLVGENTTDRVRAFELAATLDRLAGAHEQLNEGAKADTLWADSLKLFERLAETYPQDLEIAQSLARVLSALGRRADGLPAVEYYLRSLAVRKRLMTDYPAVPQYRMDYAAGAANLAAHLSDSGDLKGAEPLAADALAIRTRLAADNPTFFTHLAFLAHSRCVSGRLARLTGKPDTAAELLDKAVEGIDPLHTRDPRWSLGREIHAMCHNERASQLEERREYAKAADDWAAVAASVADPDEPTARRALALAKAGKAGTAADAADALRKQEPKDWRVQFVLARVYAVLALNEPNDEHTKSAAACLRAAVEGGLPDRPSWKWEPDLDPVRGNKEVASVLTSLKATEVLPRPRLAER